MKRLMALIPALSLMGMITAMEKEGQLIPTTQVTNPEQAPSNHPRTALPKDLIQMIGHTVATGQNIDEALRNINKLFATNTHWRSLKENHDFIKELILHLIATFNVLEKGEPATLACPKGILLEDLIIKLNSATALNYFLTEYPEYQGLAHLTRMLFKAAGFNRIVPIDALIEKWKVPVNSYLDIDHGEESTPLYYAVKKQNIATVRELLRLDANPNIPTSVYKNTPLHIIAKDPGYQSVEIAKLLIDKGALVLQENDEHKTPLSLAKRSMIDTPALSVPERKAILDLIIQAGSKP